MKEVAVGFIGFGEAAYYISNGLSTEGVKKILAFDINCNHPSLGPIIKKRASESNVTLLPSLQSLFENSDIIICSTSAKYAVPIAKECEDYLKEHHLYVDVNAASPMAMQKIASILEKTKAKFVDAAVMESIPAHKHKVPILLAGDGAQEFFEFGQRFGMNLSITNEKPGSASAIKMIRSIFMKGFTMLMIETLSASHKYGVEDYMMDSISETLKSTAILKITNNLLTRTAVHAERRVSEMEEVINTLEVNDINSMMSEATKLKLQSLIDMDLRSYFDYQSPEHYMDVIKAIRQLEESQ